MSCRPYVYGPALCVARKVQMAFKHVRCNPDVAPRLTSGGYEDKVDVITPINMFIPHEDKVDVITPVNILFRGGSEF